MINSLFFFIGIEKIVLFSYLYDLIFRFFFKILDINIKRYNCICLGFI